MVSGYKDELAKQLISRWKRPDWDWRTVISAPDEAAHIAGPIRS